MKTWLEHMETLGRDDRTLDRYRELLELYALPTVGGMQLKTLQPPHLSDLYAKLLREGRRDGKAGGLHPRTVGHVHRALHRMLKQGARWQLIARSPAADLELPSVPKSEMVTLTREQAGRLLKAAEPRPLMRHLVMLGVATGARLGELLALCWTDIDLEAGTVRIGWSVAVCGQHPRDRADPLLQRHQPRARHPPGPGARAGGRARRRPHPNQQADRAADRERHVRHEQQQHQAHREANPELLAEYYAVVREDKWRTRAQARAVELERPEWSRELGERPATVKGGRAWDRAVGQTVEYRQRWKVDDAERALGPEPHGKDASLEQRQARRHADRAVGRLRDLAGDRDQRPERQEATGRSHHRADRRATTRPRPRPRPRARRVAGWSHDHRDHRRPHPSDHRERRRRLTAHDRRRLVDELAVGSLGSDDLPLRPRGVRHGVHFGAGEQGDRGGKRLRHHSGRLHPRPLAAAEQLGQLGGLLQAGRLRAADAGLARRSGNG